MRCDERRIYFGSAAWEAEPANAAWLARMAHIAAVRIAAGEDEAAQMQIGKPFAAKRTTRSRAKGFPKSDAAAAASFLSTDVEPLVFPPAPYELWRPR